MVYGAQYNMGHNVVGLKVMWFAVWCYRSPNCEILEFDRLLSLVHRPCTPLWSDYAMLDGPDEDDDSLLYLYETLVGAG